MFSTNLLRVLVIVLLSAASLYAQTAPPQNNVQYTWAFVARAGEPGHRHIGVITKDTVLKSGDEFKVFVNLSKKCFVYIIHKNSDGQLALMFPYDTSMYQNEYSADKNFYVPKGRQWFTLDKNKGTETFYVFASSERLTELETALHGYLTSETGKKADAAAVVVNEIKETKKRFRTFSTLAERPISIAGNVRGEQEKTIDPDRIDIATLATEISANNFFSKTITIDHK